MEALSVERSRPQAYELVDGKTSARARRTAKGGGKCGMTRCGLFWLVLTCSLSLWYGVHVGKTVKYVYALGYLKAEVDETRYPTRFLVVGNWGERNQDQKDVALEMAYVAEIFKPQFVLSTGDNVYPYGLTSNEDKRFNQSWTNIYGSYPSLRQIEWYSVLGEHDYGKGNDNQNGLGETSPLYQTSSRNGEHLGEKWVCCGGKDFVIKQFPHTDLFFLDTSPFVHKYYNKEWSLFPGGIMAEKPRTQTQLDLLESQLEQSQARWKIVVGHHPIKSNGRYGDTTELQDLRNMFKQYQVNLYLNGHDLTLQDIEDEDRKDLHYITSGAGSKVQEDKNGLCCNKKVKYFGAEPGFVTVALSATEGARVQFWGKQATLLYESKF